MAIIVNVFKLQVPMIEAIFSVTKHISIFFMSRKV